MSLPGAVQRQDSTLLATILLWGTGTTAQASLLYDMEPKQAPYISVNQASSPFDARNIIGGMNLVDLLRLQTLVRGAQADAQKENERKRKASEEEMSSSSSSCASMSKKKNKKSKKKWLPPLGPPEAESVAILGKRLAGSWGHTSAEAFSTISSLRR